MIERYTAKKVFVSHLTKGRFVTEDSLNFVQTTSGDKVSRARLLGTVVGKFAADDGNFASVTIDDGTDTIRAKTFKTLKPLDTLNVGDVVDIIGKVREFNEEIYVIPESVSVVKDPNLEVLRRLEVIKSLKGVERPKRIDQQVVERDELRRRMVKEIESSKDGVDYMNLIRGQKGQEELAESIINELLGEGLCYEPTPGKIRKI